MDDPYVIKAIEWNDPLALKKLKDSFISDALGHIIQLLSKGNSKLESFSQKVAKQMEYGLGFNVCVKWSDYKIDDKFGSAAKVLIVIIQLMLWSCISTESYNCISNTLCDPKLDVYLNCMGSQELLWSWLYCLTKCVSSTTSCLYDIYAQGCEKEYCCRILLLGSSIHHNFAAFLKVGIITNITTVENSNSTQTKVKALRHKTESFLHSLQRMTEHPPVATRKRMDPNLKFFWRI